MFLQSQLCNGLYDLPPDVGATLYAPSLLRVAYSELTARNVDMADLELLLLNITDAAIEAGTSKPSSSSSFSPKTSRCLSQLRDVLATPYSERDVAMGKASATCYCELSSSPDFRNGTIHGLYGVAEVLFFDTNHDPEHVAEALKNATGLTFTEAQLTTLLAVAEVMSTVAADARFEGALYFREDVFSVAQLLMCPAVADWALRRQPEPPENEAASAAQVRVCICVYVPVFVSVRVCVSVCV